MIGEEILKPMQHPLFEIPRKIVRWHHERFDGKGYPDGLKGQEIPLEARFTFVADAYEAMTSERPYRDALQPAKAFEELACNSGSQFDPEIVEVLCASSRHGRSAQTSRDRIRSRRSSELSDDDPDEDPDDDSYEEWDFPGTKTTRKNKFRSGLLRK